MESNEYTKKFIMINKSFMDDIEEYTHREKFVYTILSALRNDLTMTSVISVDILANLLGLSLHTKNRTAIKELLISMEEKGLIKLYEDITASNPIEAKDIKVNGVYAIITCDLDTDDNTFSIVELEYLQKFINMDEKGKELYFSIYMYIIKHLFNGDSNRKYAFPTIDNIGKDTGINRKTVMKYIDVMRDQCILYYETVKIGANKDKNLYGKWHNKNEVSDAIRRIESGEEIF